MKYYICAEHGKVNAMFKKRKGEGRHPHVYCKFCNRLQNKVWRMRPENRLKIIEKNRARVKSDPEKNRAKARAWYWKNREYKMAYVKMRRDKCELCSPAGSVRIVTRSRVHWHAV